MSLTDPIADMLTRIRNALLVKKKDVNTNPIENIHNVVLILWVEDSEGNHFAFEQWINRT